MLLFLMLCSCRLCHKIAFSSRFVGFVCSPRCAARGFCRTALRRPWHNGFLNILGGSWESVIRVVNQVPILTTSNISVKLPVTVHTKSHDPPSTIRLFNYLSLLSPEALDI